MATARTEAHTDVAPLMPHSHGASAGARVVARIDAVTHDDLMRVSTGMLSRDRVRIAAVGPAESAGGLESLI